VRSPLARAWEAVFAFGYDFFLLLSERAGLTDTRRRLLSRARGRVLEIGAGTGLNVGLYPPGVTELVLTEPSPSMALRLRARVASKGVAATVVRAPAEDLPFGAASFDTVVATFVLCSVEDVAAALREAVRVLRPGGRLLFLEHVRSPEARLARKQDRFAHAWRTFACGCRCNQDTLAAIGSAMRVDEVEPYVVPRAPPFVSSAIVGEAEAVPR
jgi:ubiquinone/menaquinone biosynthesis C-methylase UbiE